MSTFRQSFIISRRRRHATGTYTNIANVAGLLSVQCEAHKVVSGASNFKQAKEMARRPHTFCGKCCVAEKATRKAGTPASGQPDFRAIVTLAYDHFAINAVEMIDGGLAADAKEAKSLLEKAERKGYLVSTVVNGTERVWQTYWTHDDHSIDECIANTFNDLVLA